LIFITLSPVALFSNLATLVIYIVSKVIGAREEAILIEDIPPLRRPTLKGILIKAWLKLEDFIIIVTPLIVVGAVIYAALAYYSLDSLIVAPLAPLAYLLHLPAKTLIPLIYGFLQKDLVIGMLAAALGTTNFLSVLTPHQIMTFSMASTYQVPCIIALGVMIKELGWSKALTLWVILDFIGFMVSALYANIAFLP
jgi:ferrous iron transport protein B